MEALRATLGRPDNLPILLMLPLVGLLVALWWRVARRNDELHAEGGEEAVAEDMNGPGGGPVGLHSWPYLVRIELVVALVVMLLLTVWSIVIDAPLEQMADAAKTPNPSKAPWYFLGLQEMLVYFDPWIAGVALPLLIIGGLCLIPYLDVNDAGNGYYSWRQRRFAIVCFMFGFLVLWLLLIFIGVFCRGPGWEWFWPWQTWRIRRGGAADPTTTLGALFGLPSAAGEAVAGAGVVLAYYGLAVIYWLWRRGRDQVLQRLGRVRYAVVAFLLLTMLALPIKMVLRWTLSLKYVWVTPWFNV